MYVCKIRPLRGPALPEFGFLVLVWPLPGSPHTRELLPRPQPRTWGPILLPGCPLVSEGPTQRPNLGWEKRGDNCTPQHRGVSGCGCCEGEGAVDPCPPTASIGAQQGEDPTRWEVPWGRVLVSLGRQRGLAELGGPPSPGHCGSPMAEPRGPGPVRAAPAVRPGNRHHTAPPAAPSGNGRRLGPPLYSPPGWDRPRRIGQKHEPCRPIGPHGAGRLAIGQHSAWGRIRQA